MHGDEIKFGHLVAEIIIAVEIDSNNQLGEKPETKEKKVLQPGLRVAHQHQAG